MPSPRSVRPATASRMRARRSSPPSNRLPRKAAAGGSAEGSLAFQRTDPPQEPDQSARFRGCYASVRPGYQGLPAGGQNPVGRNRGHGLFTLIYARDVEDVAITGKGIIDGNGASEFHGWKAKEKPDQLALRQMGISGVPVEQRRMGEGHFLRPSMIQFFGAKRVLLEDYTLKNSPFWVNHLVYTDHAIVRGLNVDSHMANNDGIDVELQHLCADREECLSDRRRFRRRQVRPRSRWPADRQTQRVRGGPQQRPRR